MKVVFKYLLKLILSVSLLSCATIVNGTKQQINILSEPSNARVIVDTSEYGTTPVIANLTRRHNHIIKIELEGYEQEIIPLNKKTSSWVVGNCLFGGLIGLGIDALTGGMYYLKLEEINSVLQANDGGFVKNEDAIVIKIVMNPNSEWKKFGQMKKL